MVTIAQVIIYGLSAIILINILLQNEEDDGGPPDKGMMQPVYQPTQ